MTIHVPGAIKQKARMSKNKNPVPSPKNSLNSKNRKPHKATMCIGWKLKFLIFIGFRFSRFNNGYFLNKVISKSFTDLFDLKVSEA